MTGPTPYPLGRRVNHEYLVEGVDVERRQVVCANSWGPHWGDAGRFRMSYETYGRLLSEQGDATVLHAAAVTPAPAPGHATFQVELAPALAGRVVALAERAGVSPAVWIAHRLARDLHAAEVELRGEGL